MPFVVEVLKQHDKQPYADTTQHVKQPSANNSWTNVLTKSALFNLVKTSLVIVKAQIYAHISEHTNVCCQDASIRIGFKDSAGNAYYIGGYNWREYNTTGDYTFDFQGFAVLPPETYDLIVDVNVYDYSYAKGGVNDLYVGIVDLADLFKVNNWKQTVTTAAGARTEFGQVNIPVLARNTVIGSLKKAMLFVFIGCNRTLWYGDGASSNYTGFQVAVDGQWLSNPTRKSTACSENNGAFHWAQIYQLIDPNVSHTVKFRQSNGSGSSQTTTYYCGVIACPWIFPSDSYYDLIDVEVPVESTVYGAIEDLFMPTQKKYAAIRSTNAINGEQNVTEFTQDPAEAAPLNFNYTPEWYETEIKLGVKGLWNCLSRLACDLRG